MKGEPKNGEDLLNHCRAYEAVLCALLAQENMTRQLLGLPPVLTTHLIECVRDSIRTAEEGMKS